MYTINNTFARKNNTMKKILFICTFYSATLFGMDDDYSNGKKLYDVALSVSGPLDELEVALLYTPRNRWHYDMSANPSRGDTVLHALAQEGTPQSRLILERLIKEGFNIDQTSCLLGHTALHVAAASLDFETSELLIKYGANPLEKVSGFSALDLAVWTALEAPMMGRISVVDMLRSMRSAESCKPMAKDERIKRALQVITVLLTCPSLNMMPDVPDERDINETVFKQLERARALCSRSYSEGKFEHLGVLGVEIDRLCRAESAENNCTELIKQHIRNNFQRKEKATPIRVSLIHALSSMQKK